MRLFDLAIVTDPAPGNVVTGVEVSAGDALPIFVPRGERDRFIDIATMRYVAPMGTHGTNGEDQREITSITRCPW